MIKNFGNLFIVPTPIGNISDITYRAIETLKKIDYIASENYKKTLRLLNNFNIKKPIISLHQHNEFKNIKKIISNLLKKKNIALVSEAGTPTINDPGFLLIRECHFKKIKIIPLPGACSIITALSASGIPSNRFCFEGFIPSKKKERIKKIKSLKFEERTIIFFETARRIKKSLKELLKEFGENRKITIARELTKYWESIYCNKISYIFNKYKKNKIICKGEIVLIISGYNKKKKISEKIKKTLKILKKYFSLKKTALLTSKIHKIKKNSLYKYLLKKQNNDKNKKLL
ncbi:16S rRNA (cytidine(1402)-2'-O)-methyltransferase [Buchnera aphidicola]|uniref:16S rRNA (cytidine(1402)-2'-O)-methyltransferase n=1 Tax=Buchnera aphidicola TaxID=9 RepID=UPI002092C6C2|nr:16S rRNA (cytidine(1402)-2'-O)-methyltransferase [Buchnera aphidicola]USS94192.1 16S rRNA (cytidine(1402)-2'-O)-methyltransferase [Buchnera aphidicola (Sipha maydis)]WII23740.1 16S rRNA (cytidine(1402)-2'-O)-methyltransferase [Buchnera aphidicola (Sipha maydis)]